MLKKQIREQYLNIRKQIPDKKDKSLAIFEKIKQNEFYKKAKIIAVYKSMPFEVNTEELINYSLSIGKTVALPKVCGDDLNFYKTNSLDSNFIKSKLGVEEPFLNPDDLVDKNDINLAIVPGVCFDEQRNRLGFGKGFYDRFLFETKIYKMALGFENQILKGALLPVNENDIKMDCIITEQNIY